MALKSYSFAAIISFLLLGAELGQARGHWTELNIGPFYVDSDGDPGAARDALTQLEQLRWVLGGLLESKDLPSLWPIRVVLTKSVPPSDPQFNWQHGMYLGVAPPDAHLPLGDIAGLLLDANTPHLPPEVESGLRELFSTLQAKGSRVSWGGAPAHPDLAWARMQLFATKFEYSASFHIFLVTIKSGSTLAAAEENAFGKDAATLEKEAAANLAAGKWQAVSVSGRPLDPKRDFGEHPLGDAAANVYLADAQLASHPHEAEAAYKAAIEAGGEARVLGYEGLAACAKLEHGDPKPFLENAIHAGSRSAPIYFAEAENMPADQALPLLKRAAQLNSFWAAPIFAEARLTSDPAGKEALLKSATQLDPRATNYWIELARVQTTQGEATAAQGTWLNAENSVPPGAERDHVHQMRLDSEQQRLDAAEEAERREREAAHLDDERAQQAEANRIRAAEARANAASDAQAGGEQPEHVVPWNDVVPHKKLEGTLIRVDCLGSDRRLLIKSRTGSIQLLLKDSGETALACGIERTPPHISLTYAAQPDDRFQTAGTIITLRIQ